MFKAKRSQAALEFLMTYGWAILIVLIVISALAYFGVLNPQAMLPSRCTLPTGWSCGDYVVTMSQSAVNDQIKLKIINGLAKSVNIVNITATPGTGTPTTSTNCSNFVQQTIPANGALVLTLTCENFPAAVSANTKYRWNIAMKYWSTDSTVDFARSLNVELYTTAE
jgi:uncharacterized protein (UPF0333 family)